MKRDRGTQTEPMEIQAQNSPPAFAPYQTILQQNVNKRGRKEKPISALNWKVRTDVIKHNKGTQTEPMEGHRTVAVQTGEICQWLHEFRKGVLKYSSGKFVEGKGRSVAARGFQTRKPYMKKIGTNTDDTLVPCKEIKIEVKMEPLE